MLRVIYLSIFLFVIISLGIPSSVCSQVYTSQNNYTGAWESNGSWNGGSSPGLYYNSDSQVLILGEITTSAPLFFNKGLLTVSDTLVVNGNLGFGSNGNLSVNSGGVLIVLGSLDVGNKVDIAAGGTIIIQGDVNFSGSSGQGSFTSDQFPAQVYIGGNITGTPPTSSDGDAIPVFDCNTVEEHENSACNYGFIEDIEGEVIEEYYEEIICGGGVNPGVIAADQNICIGVAAAEIVETLPSSESVFQWFSSIDSNDPDIGTWTAIGAAVQQTYNPGVLAQTTSFYRQVQKGNGCVANSNVVVVTIIPVPSPKGVFHN